MNGLTMRRALGLELERNEIALKNIIILKKQTYRFLGYAKRILNQFFFFKMTIYSGSQFKMMMWN